MKLLAPSPHIPKVLNAAVGSVAREVLDEVLWWIHETLSAVSGEDFFRALIGNLCHVYGMRHAFITRCLDQPVTKVRTLAFWSETGLCDNIFFALAGLPCEQLMTGTQPLWISDNLADHYPGKRGWAQGYCGLPLFAQDGVTPVGHIAFFSPGPMARNIFADPLLHIFCARATAELRRLAAEEQAQDRLLRLAHVSRLEELGHITSLVVHELTQPLSTIALRARTLQRELEAGTADAAPAIEAIAAQAERASNLVRSVRGFSRKGSRDEARCDAASAISSACALAQLEAVRREVALQCELAPDLPPVRCSAIDLQQVVANLLRNAMEALSELPAGPRWVRVACSNFGASVHIEVADNGPGFSEAARARLFEPFFTTKPQGVGLGLSLCRELLERHEGTLTATPGENGGACFSVDLKVAA